jgi:hypothetical protein
MERNALHSQFQVLPEKKINSHQFDECFCQAV